MLNNNNNKFFIVELLIQVFVSGFAKFKDNNCSFLNCLYISIVLIIIVFVLFPGL